ncbi:MAG: hypothetical protein Q4E54_02895 [Lachnospiraceae bacterium]|nr:hypothetical protein [Lachnospiraceae bacterium]
MRRIIAIVDPDNEYAGRLAHYINNHENGGFKAVIFSDTEKFLSGCADFDTRILLIDENEYPRLHEGGSYGVVICLSEDSYSTADVPSVSKYSGADLIIHFMMGEYAEHAPSNLNHVLKNPSHTIAVYSPASRCGKTTFALTVAQLLGQRGKCLLIVLDEYAGVFRHIARETMSDLSDVIYSFRQGRYSWAKLAQSVYRFGNTDYIAPVRYPEDLTAMTSVQMIELVNRIKIESGYAYIILDMGSYGKHAAELLEICDEIYMPILDDALSGCKIREFREALEQSGRTDILARIYEVKLPHEERLDTENPKEEEYSYGSLAEYTRTLFPDTDGNKQTALGHA